MDESARQLELVRRCLDNGLRNCVDWVSAAVRDRVISDPELQALSPREVVESLFKWFPTSGVFAPTAAAGDGCRVSYDYLFAALVPVPGVNRPLYVKMALADDDPDRLPEVVIVSCHLSSYSRGSP